MQNFLSTDIEIQTLVDIPDFVSHDSVPRPLVIHKEIVEKIEKDHGAIDISNFIITAHDWDYVIRNVDKNPDKINLIKLIPGSENFFVIGANRYNGYYTVTYYEAKPKNNRTLKNLLRNKGDSLDRTGEAALLSFATFPRGTAC